MKTHELRHLLKETGEAAVNLVNMFEKMIDNTDEKRERALLEKLKIAMIDYKSKKAFCEKSGLRVEINIEPAAIKIKMINPPFETQLTDKDLRILKGMRISIG